MPTFVDQPEVTLEPKTKKEFHDLWQARVDVASKKQRHKVYDRWERNLEFYRSNYQQVATPNSHVVTVDVVRAIIGLMIPAIYFRDPVVKCRSRLEGMGIKCTLHERLLNYYIEELRFKREAKAVVKDSLLYGVGYMKWGYEVITAPNNVRPVSLPDTEGEIATTAQGERLFVDDRGNIYIEKGQLLFPFADSTGRRIPPSDQKPTLLEHVQYEAPWASRWSPFDVLFDPNSLRADLSDARWVAFRYRVPLEEVKSNPNFKNTSNLKPTAQSSFLRQIRDKGDTSMLDEDTDLVTIYEIWHKKRNKVFGTWTMELSVIAEGHDKFLLDGPSPFQIDNFPVSVLVFDPDPESPHPISSIDSVVSQILTINHSRTQYTNHRERYNQKYLFNKTAGITDRDARKIALGKYGEYIGVSLEDPNANVRNAVAPLEIPPMIPEIYNDGEFAWDDIRRVLGIPEHYLGGTDVARQATQAGFIEGALNIRVNEKQDAISDWMVQIMKGWTQLLKQNATFEMTFPIHQMGEEVWQTYKVSDNIPADLDFDVDMEASAFKKRSDERREVMELLNLTANFPEVNVGQLIKDVFESYGRDPQLYLASPQQVQQKQALAAQQGADGGVGSAAENAVDTNSANTSLNVDAANSGQALG